jgi:hypothetical protein
VENPQGVAQPNGGHKASQSDDVSNKLDAFYEDLSDVDEISSEQNYQTSGSSSPPEKFSGASEKEISNISANLAEIKGNLVLHRKQLVVTAVASNMLGVVMGFGGGQFLTTGPEITPLQVLSNLPPTVVIPLLDQEDEAPALGGTGEPNQTGSRHEKLAPLVPLLDLPEPLIRQVSAGPLADLGEQPRPIVEEQVLVEVREETPIKDQKPEPPPVTVAPPPAIREERIDQVKIETEKETSKQIVRSELPNSLQKFEITRPHQDTNYSGSLTAVGPKYLVQLASCITENCVQDFQKIIERLYPQLPVRIVPYTSKRVINEIISTKTFSIEDGRRLIDQLNKGIKINAKAYLQSVKSQFQLVLGQIPKGEQPEKLVRKLNILFKGEVLFIKKSTEQSTKYFRVQVPAFDDRKKAIALKQELQNADRQMSSAFLVPNPNKP